MSTLAEIVANIARQIRELTHARASDHTTAAPTVATAVFGLSTGMANADDIIYMVTKGGQSLSL